MNNKESLGKLSVFETHSRRMDIANKVEKLLNNNEQFEPPNLWLKQDYSLRQFWHVADSLGDARSEGPDVAFRPSTTIVEVETWLEEGIAMIRSGILEKLDIHVLHTPFQE